jgi:hypothetical protein
MEETTGPRLEQRIRRLERVVAILALGFALLIVWRILPGKPVVEAREFLMRDGKGVIRGALLMLADGRPALRLNDVNGKARAMLYLNPEAGGALRLTDLNGDQRAVLELSESGLPQLRLNDENGSVRTLVRPGAESRPAIVLIGENRKTVWSSPVRQAAP